MNRLNRVVSSSRRPLSSGILALVVALSWSGSVAAALIAWSGASASSVLGGSTPATKAVDGSGWNSGTDTVGTNWTDSWLSNIPAAQWLQIDFAAPSAVAGFKFWGFNEASTQVARSISSADLSYSSDNGTNWTPIATYNFRPATGTTTYGPDIRTFAPVTATNMKLSNMVNYGANLTGVAEVKFYDAAEGLVDNTPAKILANGRITGVLATASSEWSGTSRAIDLVNSLGLTSFTDPSATHYNSYTQGPWLSNAAPVSNQWVKFDLGEVLGLLKMRIWNYQEVIERGVYSMNIYTSTTGIGNPLANSSEWSLFRSGQALIPAPNGNPIAGQDISFSPVGGTRYVAFANLVNGGNSLVGLDEVQFFVPIPEPTSLSVLALGGLALLRRRK